MKIIQLFYDGMTGQVVRSGATTPPLEIANGVKEGCVLVLVLFNLFFC